MILSSALSAFLLAFPALFTIVNPPSSALIFSKITADRTHSERSYLARRIGVYGFLVMVVSLSAGSYLLNFFGVSLGALRIAGGLVVGYSAWDLLMAPASRDQRKEEQGAPGARSSPEDVAFFPLTMPFTTGPGTIAVSIALGSEHPPVGPALLSFFIGCSAAAAVIGLMVWLAYLLADRVVSYLGRSGAQTLTRLAAFLLLCIGVQILSTGIQDLLGPLLAQRG